MHVCPECGSAEELYVIISTWAKVLIDGDGNRSGTDTDADGCPSHDHEWDEESPMECHNCGYSGPAEMFHDSWTKHERGGTVTYTTRIGGFDLSIHSLHQGRWLMDCDPLFEDYPLVSPDPNEAKCQAFTHFQAEMENTMKSIDSFIAANTKRRRETDVGER